MPSNNDFFADQTEQSRVKAQIVSSYFGAWSRVIKKWNGSMGYIDLFCGPGKYADDQLSAPLLIINSTLEDSQLASKMQFVFNDYDPTNIETLKDAIAQIPNAHMLGERVRFYDQTVGQDFYTKLNIPKNMPVLSFVDPFGYKGLTLKLIDKLIANSGSDCIFFFNYNRINMALSSNTKFDDYLNGLFGEQRTQDLKKQLSSLPPAQREPVVLNALIEALRESKGNYVLPFKFYSTEMLRTSHFIIFVTKHPVACKIMKQIMYTNSAKDCDGVATFSFEDSRNFGSSFQQISLFDRPLDSLQEQLIKEYQSTEISVAELCNKVDCDFSNHYIGKNVKTVLKRMETSGLLEVVSGRKQKMRNGELNMPDAAIVKFL